MEIIKIYLAGPAYYEEDEGRTWRLKADQMFKAAVSDKDCVIKIIDPMNFFNYSDADHQSDSQVKKFYTDQILHSRLVLCNLDHTRTSPGTAQELQYAVDHNVPIIGFSTEDEVYPWLKVDCQCVMPSMLQAIDYIVDKYCY